MAVYIDDDTRLVVQGATGYAGQELIPELEQFGTDVVAGVSRRRDVTDVAGVPIYRTVSDAVAETGANTSFVLVPAPYAKDACLAAIDAGVEVGVTIAESVPAWDTLAIAEYARRHDATVIGPNTLGVISPGKAATLLSYHSNSHWYTGGSVGIVARSGSLSAEVADLVTKEGLGQSTVLSVGGDPYLGTTPAQVFRAFDADRQTEAIAYIGEVGGQFEERAAAVLSEIETPVFATIVGQHAPPGKKMGHAGAIADTDQDKLGALSRAGARVVDSPFDLPDALVDHLG